MNGVMVNSAKEKGWAKHLACRACSPRHIWKKGHGADLRGIEETGVKGRGASA